MKQTKFGDYERKVVFPVWSNYTIHIVFTTNIAESRKARYGSAGESDGARALHSSAQGGHSHLFFRIGDTPVQVIAHEAWHAVRCMLVDFGGVTVMENEVTAYHLGYLVGEVARFKNALIDANIGVEADENRAALIQSRVLGVKSSSRKQVVDGNEGSQRTVAGVQSLPAHGRGVGTEEEGTARTPAAASQADGYVNDAGYDSASASLSGTGRTRG